MSGFQDLFDDLESVSDRSNALEPVEIDLNNLGYYDQIPEGQVLLDLDEQADEPTPGPSRTNGSGDEEQSEDGRTTAEILGIADDTGQTRDFEGFYGEMLKELMNLKIEGRHAYYSDVLQTDAEGQELLEQYIKQVLEYAPTHYNQFFLVARHLNHCHIVHSCTYSNFACRCNWRVGPIKDHLKAPRYRRTRFSQWSHEKWYQVLRYYASGQRKILYLKIGNVHRTEKDFANAPLLRLPGVTKMFAEMQMQSCSFIDGVKCVEDLIQDVGVSARSKRSMDGQLIRFANAGSRQDAVLLQKIMDIFRKQPCSPISDIVNYNEWIDDPFLAMKRNDHKSVKNAFDVWAARTLRWRLMDYVSLYTAKGCIPRFNAGVDPIYKTYYGLAKSVWLVAKLLRFQFNNDNEKLREFLKTLLKILEKENQKTNTIAVVSQPSAGKNWFFDSILHFYGNYGQIGRANRTNGFSYQDMVNRRIGLFNEPNYEDSEIDFLKMLLGGDNVKVRVKCKDDMPVHKTPIILLTNDFNLSLFSHEAFKHRIVKYEWKAAPFLAACTKKPYPLMWFYLLKLFDIPISKSRETSSKDLEVDDHPLRYVHSTKDYGQPSYGSSGRPALSSDSSDNSSSDDDAPSAPRQKRRRMDNSDYDGDDDDSSDEETRPRANVNLVEGLNDFDVNDIEVTDEECEERFADFMGDVSRWVQ